MIPSETFQYMKEHLGCMYSIAFKGKHRIQWTKTKLTEQDLANGQINCLQELPNEITLESDYKDEEQYKNKENQDHAESILQREGAGYYISSHKGKSDYIRFRFKTTKPITPQLRLAIIRYLAKPGLQFDEAFFSLKFVRPIPGKFHWKHSLYEEKVIKVVQGSDLDIDALGIVEPPKKQTIHIASGSIPGIQIKPMGWAGSISIVKMADKYNIKDCPVCSKPLTFIDKVGWWKCSGCGLKGGLKDFARLILNKPLEATS